MTTIALPDIGAAVAERYGGLPLPYLALYRAALDRRIPVRRHNGRWFLDEVDLPAVAEIFGRVPDDSETA
jgi:hypothetical protein